MTIFTYVIAFLIAIGVLVAIHEFGHFWMARRLGIRVVRFSVGFGRPLWRRKAADGTEYALSAIPLGGYVKLLDEREGPVPAEHLSQAYNRQPVWRRVTVLLAGPAANFLFAVCAYWLLFVVGVPALTPVVGTVEEGSFAARAGLREGDEILRVGARETPTRETAVIAILEGLMKERPIELRLARADGSTSEVALRIEGSTRGLTEPGALLPGLGFDFWYPTVPPVAGHVLPGSAAERAGLRTGDRIVAIDGEAVEDFPGLVRRVQPNPGRTLEFTIERQGERMTLPIEVQSQREGDRMVGRIGVQPVAGAAVPDEMRTVERYGVLDSLRRATAKTWGMSVLTVRMLWNVVTGDVSVRNLSGPINIAEYAGFSLQQGALAYLSFLAIVSVSLFVLNLLPIPILDGGQIVFQLAELAKGSPLSERAQAVGQQIGLFLLLVLMSFAFYNDLSRLFS
jgi:regulator of sigma E protease